MFSNRLMLVVATAWMASLGVLEARAETICVDDDFPSGGDGTCWTSPFRHLQDALAIASVGDEVHVAGGVYKPDQAEFADVALGDRSATFQLVNGVTIRGGYRGCPGGDCESGDPSERNFEVYESILSGDLNGDDGPARRGAVAPCFSGTDVPLETGCEGFDLDEDGDIDGDDFGVFANANNYDDNSYHVVTATGTDGTAMLDGFTITAGNADGPTEENHDKGGGMLNNASSPTLNNCEFEGNSAQDDAGGTYNSSSSGPTLTECNFYGNYAGDAGGGMKNESSSPKLTSCMFTGNAAGTGGGLYNRDGSDPTLTSCTFNSNSASRNGGGMANNANSNPSLTNCTFTTNSAGWGGGMHNKSSSPTLTACTFSENAAVHDGGGMHNAWESAPEFTDCAFSANATSASGGGMFNWRSTPSLTRCTFTENSAAWGGGGMCNGDSRSPTLNECTFTGNSASGGGGIENFANSTPSLSSCTFNGNSAIDSGGGINNSESNPSLTNCSFIGNWSADNGGGMANGDSSPTLENCTFDGNSAGTDGGGMMNWNNSSPTLTSCIFSGNSAQNGGGGVNGGNSSSPLLTDCTFSDNSAGWGGGMNNWQGSPSLTNCAFSRNAAAHRGGGMSNGESNPTLEACAFEENFASIEGGGMANSESSPMLTECSFTANAAEVGGGMHNWRSSSTLTTSMFTNNTADAGGAMHNQESNPALTDCAFDTNSAFGGGGINNWASSPSLTGCTFTGNAATQWDGGGMHNGGNSAPTLIACTFTSNLAASGGGGMNNSESSPTLTECNLTDNTAEVGGGMYNWQSSPTLTGCTFSENTAEAGGAMHNQDSAPNLTNCTFDANSALGGGGINNWASSPSLTGCTFTGNLATQWDGGGIANGAQSNPELTECTFRDNSAACGGAIDNWKSGPVLTNCDFVTNHASDGGGMCNRDHSNPELHVCTFAGNSADAWGGGMNNHEYSTPIVTDCTFDGNTANAGGGGMHNSISSPVLTRCAFTGHLAPSGAGMHNDTSSPNLRDCTFMENTADDGGGMKNWQSSPTLADCDFIDNVASAYSGGGVCNEEGSNARLSGCRFIANRAEERGGGFHNWESSPTLTDCIFAGNSARWSGGLNNDSNGDAELTGCMFFGNRVSESGGAVSNTNNSDPVMANCVFSGNSADVNGGAIDNWNDSDPLLTNCTITGNSAGYFGGGINNWQGWPVLTNCILWDNSDNDGEGASSQIGGGAPVVSFSCVQDEDPDDEWIYPGDGNIDDDPLFVDADGPDDIAGTEDDDVHLLSDSPCINVGSNHAPELPVEDMDGEPRIQNCRVDMGADESPFWPPLDDCNGNNEEDDCDVYNHNSKDANRNHTPDECEPDCNENGFPDFLDLLFGFSEDCNFNDVPDECEPDEDCNDNGIQDICDVAGDNTATTFASTLVVPQDIVVSRGDYPAGLLVTGPVENAVYHISELGGSVERFADGLSFPIGAEIMPHDFTCYGNRLFVVNEFGGNVAVAGPTGEIEEHIGLPLQYPAGIEYIPLTVGGPFGGRALVTGCDTFEPSGGRILLLDEWCRPMVIRGHLDPVWTPTLAPADFGGFGYHIFIGETAGAHIYALNTQNLELTKFATAPFDEHLHGLRQIAFSPPGWAASVDLALQDERILLISVASEMSPPDVSGKGVVMAWDQRGRLVAVLRNGPNGADIEPRGLTFVGEDLLISDATAGRGALLRVSVGNFGLPDCNADGVPDGCQIADCPDGETWCQDCNDNAVLDGCEEDCNNNSIPDQCDIDGAASADCNRNYVPDECEPDEDCNDNGIQDICDVGGWGDVTICTDDLVSPEDIVPSRGDYPDGYLVTGVSDGVVYHVSPSCESVTEFATGLTWPVGARMLPAQFSSQGDLLAVADGADIVFVDPAGNVQMCAELPLQHAAGIEYVPFEIRGRAAGKIVVTGYDSFGRGHVFTVDNACMSESRRRLPSALWTPTLAPHDFGTLGDHVFVGAVMGPRIYALDLETFEFARFAEAPFDENLRGLRQIAFSPPGWGSVLDPTLSEERLMLISAAHQMFPEDVAGEGAIMAWDSRGRLVAVMQKGPDGQTIEPRGLTFDVDDLLISDMTQGRDAILRATIDDFRLLDCNHNDVPDRCEIESCLPDDLHCRDCNANGVPDGCERDCNESGVPDECEPISGGDFTGNGEVNLDDFFAFTDCMAGPTRPPTPGQSNCTDACLDAFDFEEDGDVDLDDFGALQQAFGQASGAAACGTLTPSTGERQGLRESSEIGGQPIVPEIGVMFR